MGIPWGLVAAFGALAAYEIWDEHHERRNPEFFTDASGVHPIRHGDGTHKDNGEPYEPSRAKGDESASKKEAERKAKEEEERKRQEEQRRRDSEFADRVVRSLVAQRGGRRGFGASLTSDQIAWARKFERAGLTSYSQAVKAFERGESSRIREWVGKVKNGA